MKYILVFFALIYCFRLSLYGYGDMPLYSIIAMTVVYLGLLFVLFLVGFHYLNLILSLGEAGRKWRFFILSSWALFIISSQDLAIFSEDKYISPAFILFTLVFVVEGNRLMTLMVKKFPIGRKDVGILTSRYPPLKRSDLIKGDLVMIAITFIPFLAKVMH